VVENPTSEFKNRSNSQATSSGQTPNKLTKDKHTRTAVSVPKSTHMHAQENVILLNLQNPVQPIKIANEQRSDHVTSQ